VQEFRSPIVGGEFGTASKGSAVPTRSWSPDARQSAMALVAQPYTEHGGPAIAVGEISPTPVHSLTHLDNAVPVCSTAVGPSAEIFRFSDLRYLGQIMSCYLVCEHQEKLVVVDMHAAHERYNFNLIRNRFRDRNEQGAAPRQQLLIPITVVLGDSNRQHLLSNTEIFERFGFEIEGFGPDGIDAAIVVRAAPPEVTVDKIAQLVMELAHYRFDGGEDSRSPQPLLEERLDHICARLACHASIRGGDIINRDQVYRLFSALDSTEFSAACPHGRPVVVEFEKSAIERWFGRDR